MLVATTIVPSLILCAGLIDDLRSRKVHNWLILSLAGLSLTFLFFHGGGPALEQGLYGMGAALLVGIPLVLMRILGAGDMKLLAVFGLVTSWSTALSVVGWSVIWGAVLGLFYALVTGRLKALFTSTGKIASGKTVEKTELQTIPYTVAILLGWLSYLTQSQSGGLLW